MFIARGNPVIYYGSESGFMRGRVEHHGNRSYLGEEASKQAQSHPIHSGHKAIAHTRAKAESLQRDLMLIDTLQCDVAVFCRVLAYQGKQETVLVMLNKSAEAKTLRVDQHTQSGEWQDLLSGANT
ncbi:MAG: hypothetical protein JNN30_09475 [Rhodanobacteraceae bacterium]|nr:hypothetical protein [Rhodanobacteraceae bacterium]